MLGRKGAGRIWAGAAMVLLMGSEVFGACATQGPYIDNCSGATCGSQTGLSGGLGSTIIPYFWIMGSGGTLNSSACAAGNLSFKTGGNYQILSSWGTKDSTNKTVNCATGCPSPTGTTRQVFVYSNQATGNGPGSYILMSVLYSSTGTTFNYYNISNGTANGGATVRDCAAIAIPTPTITNAVSSGSNWIVTVTWPTLTPGGGFNQLRGYYDSDPGQNLLTRINLRYAQAGTAPVSDLSNYPNVAGYADVSSSATDPATATLTIPKSANPTWIRMFLVFDNGAYETLWGGPTAPQLGPTAAPLFSGQGAGADERQVTVSWRSNVETDVAFYEVCYAARKAGPYDPVPGAVVLPAGNNHEYCASFPMPLRSGRAFLKVRALKFDGSAEWSDPMRVTASARPGRFRG